MDTTGLYPYLRNVKSFPSLDQPWLMRYTSCHGAWQLFFKKNNMHLRCGVILITNSSASSFAHMLSFTGFYSKLLFSTAACVMGKLTTCLVVPTKHCTPLLVVVATCAEVAVATTSFLFFMRIQAVCAGTKYVAGIFGIIWLITITLCLAALASSTFLHAGQF